MSSLMAFLFGCFGAGSSQDRRQERSHQTARQTDASLIDRHTFLERQAVEDRIFAERLAGGGENVHRNTNSASSNSASSRHLNRNRVKCVVCMDEMTVGYARVSCNHAYHTTCLKDLFMAAMRDESLMPPRCCRQEIPAALAHLTKVETENFEAKKLELSTPDRLYCSRPTCSTFIPPTRIIRGIATCPRSGCTATTCAVCKSASHAPRACVQDANTHDLLKAARAAGWARCYRCRTLIELTHGCYHMTCRCRAEFCYVCAAPWKTCACPQWDEQRLLADAQRRVARAPPARRAPEVVAPVGRVDRVAAMVNELRNNHECNHGRGWNHRPGRGRCEVCHQFLPLYLFACRQCQLMACNRCRHNRL